MKIRPEDRCQHCFHASRGHASCPVKMAAPGSLRAGDRVRARGAFAFLGTGTLVRITGQDPVSGKDFCEVRWDDPKWRDGGEKNINGGWLEKA